ncbi:15817_t:CDS:2 [Dentiscutata heterogama]|uniref:15817_t:CDS:1 n=1 Tax=Dentiscutata heterogama TaxID=1316150 RepID=A0ACA9LZV3_9GLOM|nr:15817_t:CDS:2 [Dentiscutata heterogama]
MTIVVSHQIILMLRQQKKALLMIVKFSKYQIDKDHPEEANSNGSIIKAMHVINDYAELLFEPIDPSQPTNNEYPDELDIEDKFDTQIISEQLRCQLIEFSITTKNLCDLVKATSYLSLQEYWKTPEEIGLVASFLDPRIKHLKFLIELDKSSTMSTLKPATTNDLIAALYSSEKPKDKILNETEVVCCLRKPVEKMGCNPLAW